MKTKMHAVYIGEGKYQYKYFYSLRNLNESLLDQQMFFVFCFFDIRDLPYKKPAGR